MDRDQLHEAIAKLPGGDGWWHSSNGDTYKNLANQLLAAGLDADRAFDVLETAYWAAADEFGM